MIVVDASAIVDLLARREPWRLVEWHLRQAERLVAPDLLYPEVTSAVARLERAGVLPEAAADLAIKRLRVMPLDVVGHRDLVAVAWELRASVRVTDAYYLACAAAVGTPLLTTDARLARGHHAVPVLLVS